MEACGSPRQEPPTKEIVMWKQLGSWSGRGNAQTESFVGLTGSLRFHWRTTEENPKGQGRFKLILQSAISGRALQEPVDEVWTLAWEGGHQDHDAAHLVAIAFANRRGAPVFEVPLYHGHLSRGSLTDAPPIDASAARDISSA